MHSLKGDIWVLANDMDYVVIPTNIGYTKHGYNVMGRGLARQAALRFPSLTLDYGDICMKHQDQTPCVTMRARGRHGSRNIILFPVKPFNSQRPYLSWRQPASIELIRRSLFQLATLADCAPRRVFIPDVGCGNGQLKVGEVRPLIEEYLGTFANVVHVIHKR
jgi:hypothetical protein